MNTLKELKGAPQATDEHRRQWFSSNDLDLVVWFDNDAIAGFELYYDKNIREHVFIWMADSGFEHLAVDDGEQMPVLEFKKAPILIPDGHVDPPRIRDLFKKSCENVPAEITDLVLQKLARYAEHL